MKKILFVKDRENEVGFDVLCNYCAKIQERLGQEVVVLPIWPNGEVDLIGDKRQMKLLVKDIREALNDIEIELNK